MKIPKPPKHLDREGKKMWRGIHRDYEITECHDLNILAEACCCKDMIYKARQESTKAGPFYKDRFGQPREHPSLKTERDYMILLARLLRELNLDIQPPENRPPGRY